MAKVDITATREIEDIVDSVLETVKQLKKVVRKSAKPVLTYAKTMAPRGDLAHHPEAKALKDSLRIHVHEDGHEVMAFVSAASRHSHLVQLGHRIYRRGPEGDSARNKNLVPLSGASYALGRSFIQPAVDVTQHTVDRLVKDQTSEIWGKASR